jgi:hypothetical protein
MAVKVERNRYVYSIVLFDTEMQDLEYLIESGKAEYVAGFLIGKLQSNFKLVVGEEKKSVPVESK